VTLWIDGEGLLVVRGRNSDSEYSEGAVVGVEHVGVSIVSEWAA
jgi:hypothetical protein